MHHLSICVLPAQQLGCIDSMNDSKSSPFAPVQNGLTTLSPVQQRDHKEWTSKERQAQYVLDSSSEFSRVVCNDITTLHSVLQVLRIKIILMWSVSSEQVAQQRLK